VNMRLLRDLVLAEHQRGATVIFSTHVMIQAEQLCDHIVMIDRGKKVLDDSLEAIKRQFDPRTLVCEPLDSAADMASVEALPEVASVIRDNGSWTISLAEGVAPTDALRAIAGTQDLVRIELQRPSLEDVFVEQVAAGSRSAKDLAELRASLRAEPQEVAS
jgi:ABC-2 type transport system ATP-binding protein